MLGTPLVGIDADPARIDRANLPHGETESGGRLGAVLGVLVEPELVGNATQQTDRAQDLDLGLHCRDIQRKTTDHVGGVRDLCLAGVEQDESRRAVFRRELRQNQPGQGTDQRRHPRKVPLPPVEQAKERARIVVAGGPRWALQPVVSGGLDPVGCHGHVHSRVILL